MFAKYSPRCIVMFIFDIKYLFKIVVFVEFAFDFRSKKRDKQIQKKKKHKIKIIKKLKRKYNFLLNSNKRFIKLAFMYVIKLAHIRYLLSLLQNLHIKWIEGSGGAVECGKLFIRFKGTLGLPGAKKTTKQQI